MRKLILSALAIGAAMMTGAMTPAAAATISFETLPVGAFSGPLNFGGGTFTSSTGQLYVGAAGGDHALCPFQLQSCAAAITVDFGAPVNDLRFLVNADDRTPSQVFVTGTAAAGAFSFTSGGFDGNIRTFTPVDLSGFAGITSITLTNNDIKGLGYDYFSFNRTDANGGTAGAVPEPTTWAMMLGGLGLVGGAMRRRNRATVAA